MSQKVFKQRFFSNVVVGDFDEKDFPNFTDAYIESAYYDKKAMTRDEIKTINEEMVYALILQYKFYN